MLTQHLYPHASGGHEGREGGNSGGGAGGERARSGSLPNPLSPRAPPPPPPASHERARSGPLSHQPPPPPPPLSHERPLWRRLLGLYGDSDVPPERVAGSVCVVTGANSGVGFALCASLCRLGAGAIFCLGRDEARLREAVAELESIAFQSARERVDAWQRRSALPPVSAAAAGAIAVPGLAATQLIPMAVDLEVAGEVARAAFSIEARAPHVDCLVLCAGRYVDAPFHLAEGWGPHAVPVGGGGEEGEGEEGAGAEKQKPWGIESTLAANYYGHCLLTSMLMPKLLLRAQDLLSQGALHRPPPPVAAAAAAPKPAQPQPQLQPQPQHQEAATATTNETAAKATSPSASSAAAATSAAEKPRSSPVPAADEPPAAAATPTPHQQQQQHPHPHHLRGITAVTGRSAAAQRPLSPGGGPAGRASGPAAVRLPHGSRPLPRARVVWVASQAEQYAPALGEFLLDDPTGERLGTGGMAAYARSKAMGVLFVRELARRVALGAAKADAAREAAALGGDSRRAQAPSPRAVDVLAVHPGLVDSPLMAKTSPSAYPLTALLSRLGAALIGLSPRQGASPLLYAATSPELDGRGGAFVGPSYVTNLGGAAVREPTHADLRSPDMWSLCWYATRRVLLRAFRPDSRVAARLTAVLGGEHRALPACA
jgi:NAD(P)-dependent dehydrogenase (short-subunit alcohol dehydrogenase family)